VGVCSLSAVSRNVGRSAASGVRMHFDPILIRTPKEHTPLRPRIASHPAHAQPHSQPWVRRSALATTEQPLARAAIRCTDAAGCSLANCQVGAALFEPGLSEQHGLELLQTVLLPSARACVSIVIAADDIHTTFLWMQTFYFLRQGFGQLYTLGRREYGGPTYIPF
jgi:hypothetical protein